MKKTLTVFFLGVRGMMLSILANEKLSAKNWGQGPDGENKFYILELERMRYVP